MLKIGVIGVGKLGKLHATILKESINFKLVGCFDNDPIALKNVCESLDIMPYTSALSLIKDCDAIDIVTNASSHYEYAVAALKNAKHVFIEKPFTQTLQEAQHLVQLSHEADVKIQVGYIERFNPAYKNIEAKSEKAQSSKEKEGKKKETKPAKKAATKKTVKPAPKGVAKKKKK